MTNPFQPTAARKSQKPPPRGDSRQNGNPFDTASRQGQNPPQRGNGPQQGQNTFGDPNARRESFVQLAYYPNDQEVRSFLENKFGKVKWIGDRNLKFGMCSVVGSNRDVMEFVQETNKNKSEGPEDKYILLAALDPSGEQSGAFIDLNFQDMMRDDGTLDMSEISPALIDFSNMNAFGFFFYVLTIYCHEWRFDVQQVVCERNSLSEDHMAYFRNIRTVFPNVTRVYLDGNYITPQISPEEIEFTIEPWRSYAGVRVSPLEVTPDSDIAPARKVFELGEYRPLKLDPSASPVTCFLVHFFECAWTRIGEIGRFYEKDKSEFSVTIDVCRERSALYQQFRSGDCNWLRCRNCVDVGAQKIGDRQRSLFPQGFQAHPTSVSWCGFGPNICGVVVRGAFQSQRAVFLFHRSFTLREVEGVGIMVAADNLYIQEPR